MPAHDPKQRSLIARIASAESWANTSDPTARTANARAAADARFERQVDPDGVMPEAERRRRAEAARRAHYLRMALKSADSRRRRAQADELRRLADEIDGAA